MKIWENKIFKITFGLIKTFFVLILIAYIALVLIQRFSSKSILGYHFYTIATGSMEGIYNINDVIAVKEYDASKLKVGDDITYAGNIGELHGKIITHRIESIEETKEKGYIITTKGTKSTVEDPPIQDSQVIGKVVGKIPIITQINHIVKTQAGFFTIIFCPLVFIIVIEILQTITDYQIEKNELKRIEKE